MTKRPAPAEPDDDVAAYTFDFMVSGEITIYASDQDEAEEFVRAALERIKVGAQDIDATVETCNLQ